MEGLDYPNNVEAQKHESPKYTKDNWVIHNNNAIYNGYYIINIEEFKRLYSLYNHNATRVKKHWDKEGRHIPAEVVYSLRRFLDLPKFIFKTGSWYDRA